jgi:D-amino-acid dehydrogenase
MAALKADVMVLGAGMVGVSTALHLQARGRDVVLVDRRGAAGEETSYGNAGLIERSAIFPHAFPRELGAILRYALNRSPEAHYHFSALPAIAPWLTRYFSHSSETGMLRTAKAMLPLVEGSLVEHEGLMREANATHLFRKSGWIKLFRSPQAMAKGLRDVERIRRYGLAADLLGRDEIRAREPHLQGDFAGGTFWHETGFVLDPGALVKAYAQMFVARGGRFISGDAKTLLAGEGGWRVGADGAGVNAREAVIALGPWSDDIFRPLGYRIPLAVKRGYHRHYRGEGNAVLGTPVLDVDGGYALLPMTRGYRITTGAEFAKRDAPPTPVQLERCEAIARTLFPLGEGIEATPWIGSRPCLPDMLPVIGKARRHAGLWFNFGHQHLGFTLGPVSGRLIAEMMTGQAPFADPTPFAAERFG